MIQRWSARKSWSRYRLWSTSSWIFFLWLLSISNTPCHTSFFPLLRLKLSALIHALWRVLTSFSRASSGAGPSWAKDAICAHFSLIWVLVMSTTSICKKTLARWCTCFKCSTSWPVYDCRISLYLNCMYLIFHFPWLSILWFDWTNALNGFYNIILVRFSSQR